MTIFEQILIGLALAMDALAISICLGLATENKTKEALSAGLWFGGAQGLMALIGYFLGASFREYIERFDHWIVFAVLLYIGIVMIKEAIETRKKGDSCERRKQSMALLAIASSIDALAVGITLSLTTNEIFSPVIIIGILSFIISYLGVMTGIIIGARRKYLAEFSGGIILILIGSKVLLESII